MALYVLECYCVVLCCVVLWYDLLRLLLSNVLVLMSESRHKTSLSVFISVCPVASLKNHIPSFTKFSVHVIWSVAQSSDDSGIRYVLLFLWITSCFPVIGFMACGIGIM